MNNYGIAFGDVLRGRSVNLDPVGQTKPRLRTLTLRIFLVKESKDDTRSEASAQWTPQLFIIHYTFFIHLAFH